GAWTKTVPQGVLSGSREAVVGFLQGLFDADGHARADGFELGTRSWKLAQGVQLLLANMSIIGRLNSKIVAEHPMWTLFIGGENAAKFHSEVGFRLARKQAVWSENSTPRGWCISELVPNANSLLVALLNRTAPHSREVHRAFDHAKRDDCTPTRRSVEKMLSLLPETVRDEPEFATLRALCDERFFWDAVSSVKASENEAYDFVVPGTHSFLANGIYNHNTTLAYIIAEELGRDIALTSGPSLERPGDVMGFLVNAKEGDIIFIDEIHRLPRIVEEFLYSAMEDYIVNFTLDKGMYSKPLPIRLEKFTIIGATTRPAMLTRPLRDRFGLQQHFDFYTDDDLVSIVRRSAHILGTPTDAEAAREIARRSRGTPRIANRLLRRVRDFAQVRADGQIDPQIARDGMKLEGIDELGLDRLDHAMMNVIKDVYEGGPVGIEALAATLNEESDTLVDVVEPYLLKIGFLARTPAGRRITKRAYEHLGALPPATAMTPQLTLIEEAVEADERLREIKRKRNGDEK
ncbi:MAG TPA: Holliday junction branch migration DNA helicase RuvB, partial [Abditibacterium sp.]